LLEDKTDGSVIKFNPDEPGTASLAQEIDSIVKFHVLVERAAAKKRMHCLPVEADPIDWEATR